MSRGTEPDPEVERELMAIELPLDTAISRTSHPITALFCCNALGREWHKCEVEQVCFYGRDQGRSGRTQIRSKPTPVTLSGHRQTCREHAPAAHCRGLTGSLPQPIRP